MVSKIDRLNSSFIEMREEMAKVQDELKVLQFRYLSLQKRVVQLLQDQQNGRQENL